MFDEINLPSLEEVDNEIERLNLEDSLYEFTLWVFEKIYRREFFPNWHHQTLCQVLQDIHSGKLLHTIINIPPRYTKTEIVVKIFIAWCYAKDPDCEFIHLAYSDDLALANSAAVREIIQHEEYQKFWPIQFKQDSTAKKKWKTVDGGEMSAAATGGAVTGFGAGKLGAKKFKGALIVDDPLKPEDSNSDTVRDSINNRFPQTLKSRLNDRLTPMIVIMQRLHENDPAGFLLGGGTELKFTHINLPAINEDGPSKYDPREKGEVLWPDKHDEIELEEMRKKSAMTFAGQYQQRPAPAEGNLFKTFKFYTELPKYLPFRLHSWDFTFKKTKTSDYVVGTYWGRSPEKDIYLIDLVRAKMNFGESLEAIKLFTKKHPDYRALLVEDKANGSAIIDSIKSEIKKVIPITPTETKEERAEAVAPMFVDVYLPHPSIAPWIEDYINEHKIFPNGKHDDQVDSTTQALNYMDNNNVAKLPDANKNQNTFRKTFDMKAKDRRARDRKTKIKIKSF